MRGGEQLLSFITCKRKSAVNCLPIAYHPLLVTLSPSLSPSPPNLSCLSLLSSFTHSSLRSTAERHQLTFNTFISVCLKSGPPVCLPVSQAGQSLLFIIITFVLAAITWPHELSSFVCPSTYVCRCINVVFVESQYIWKYSLHNLKNYSFFSSHKVQWKSHDL